MGEARTNIERADDATGGAVARPSTEPEYVGQIAVPCELCLALHARDEFLRDRFVRELPGLSPLSVAASALGLW